MGRNDRHLSHDGKIRPELEPGYEELLAHRDSLDAKIVTKLMEMPMLTGKGFIVIDPNQPRFDGQEFEKVEDAEERASGVAYQGGKAIIYAPIGVVKPKRDTLTAVPSDLLKQISARDKSLPTGTPVATSETKA